MRFDVAIAGGGLAGSAAAALFARAGRRVLLLERDRFPRDKLCGEFLSPESAAELDRLGVLPEIEALRPHPIRRARFTAETGRTLELELPGAALGLTRKRLDQILFENARRSGAEAVEEAEVVDLKRGEVRYIPKGGGEEKVEADLVIAAHGRRSKLDRALLRPFMDRLHPFVAMKRHFHGDPMTARALEGWVEVHAFDGGYCGFSFVETGEINACALFEQRFFEATEAKDWPNLVRAMGGRSRTLAARFEGLTPSDAEVLAVAQIPFEEKARFDRGILFIGDAAGMIAPLAGDGQAMALCSARMLFEIASARKLDDTDAIGAAWDRAWRRTFDRRMRLGRFLQRALFRPRTADLSIRTIGAIPGLASALTRATRGSAGVDRRSSSR